MTALDKHYDGAAAAAKYAPQWADAGYAKGDPQKPGPAFSMIMPPPNVTGSLHMGHALNNTLQDVLARYRRMDGDNVCWIPGLDHASIAVHWLLEKMLRAEGTTSRKLGREAFLARAWQFKADVEKRIVGQQKSLALSCDWHRLTFTLDEGPSRAVTEAFVRLYEDGLMYRDERLVNWDTVSQTSVSDLEVVYEENVVGQLFHFAYPFAEGNEEIVVATTRPETMLGDTAVAVHPDDPRYNRRIGEMLQHPFLDRQIPIIADAVLVDPSFGTGAVKITPAHSFNDFEVGRRHQLKAINLLQPDGTLNEQAGPFCGMSVMAAREAVMAQLEEMKLARGTTPHTLNLGRSERSGAIIEPYLSTQWYVRTKPLRTPSVAAVLQKRSQFVPAGWQNTYFSWLNDIRDWCISRQLWWGHRIPAWTCEACHHLHVARSKPAACDTCRAAGEQLRQDPDVLDTWFSSALWPFSTLGWPPEKGAAASEAMPSMARYYPTQTLITSFDIIFFWVARMMMMGQYLTGSVPFAEIYMHALIRDAAGEKMSKTKGNVVDPQVMIERYGLDAFRFTLVAFAGQGREVRWDEARAAGYQRFINKIWQAFRFVAMKVEAAGEAGAGSAAPASDFDAWLHERTDACVVATRAALDAYKFNEAADAIYHFVWNELCDWSLELAKVVLHDAEAPKPVRARTLHGLLDAFDVVARLLHPICPYLSEELYQQLAALDPRKRPRAPHAMVAPFPRSAAAAATDAAARRGQAQRAEFAIGAVRALRRVRGDFGVPVKEAMAASVRGEPGEVDALRCHAPAVLALAGTRLAFDGAAPTAASAFELVGGTELTVPLAELIDVTAQGRKLADDVATLRREADTVAAMLARPDFVARAPAEVVAQKRAQQAAARSQAERLERARQRLLAG